MADIQGLELDPRYLHYYNLISTLKSNITPKDELPAIHYLIPRVRGVLKYKIHLVASNSSRFWERWSYNIEEVAQLKRTPDCEE